jgi:hypothetical protein
VEAGADAGSKVWRSAERTWESRPTRPCRRDDGRSRRIGARWRQQPPAPDQGHERRPRPAGEPQ